MNDSRNASDSVDRLLDAAERLFGELGFEGVGMRSLAEEAGVNLGAATYHFGGKQGLYEATFLRRFQPTHRERIAMLDAAETRSGGASLPLEILLECFLRPPFMTTTEHPNFVRFMARNLFMPPPFMFEIIQRETREEMRRFKNAFARALPELPPTSIKSRISFCMGALLITAARPAPIFEGSPAPDNETTFQELLKFCVAGMRNNETYNPLPNANP